MRLLGLLVTRVKAGGRFAFSVSVFCFAVANYSASQARPWDRPAAEMARRIADVLGPASAHLTIRNISTISSDAVPVIRRAIEDDLKADGVSLTSGESANAVRITLSENTRGGLWVAELVEGNQTRVEMVAVDLAPQPGPAEKQKVALHREPIAKASQMQWKPLPNRGEAIGEIVAASEVGASLVVLTPEQISVFQRVPAGWQEQEHAGFGASHPIMPDTRGLIVPLADDTGFEAFAPGVECTGTFAAGLAVAQGGAWTIHCHPSDDPWTLTRTGTDSAIKGFYNSRRDYFTGVVIPAVGTDLPPFYAAGLLSRRASGTALLIGGIDGKVLIAENGELKPVAGTRDWGSDFAVVFSGCGAGADAIVSSSGEGASDSIRAYGIPAQEAVAMSDPLNAGGTVMALSPALDGKSAIAIVRTALQEGQRFDYEVDRVTETCN